jgi:hypothetical protein
VPFTLAHGAAALLFKRLHLIPSPLLVGAFAPDYEYFFRLGPNGRYGHTVLGALTLTLPVAVIVLWLFHTYVKVPAARLLPEGMQRRLTSELGEFQFGGAGRFALIVCSILLGIATHLGWDAFTHPNTWAYRHWPALRQALRLPFLGPVPYYKLLQHGSTVVGLGILAVWVVRWYRRTKPTNEAVVTRPENKTAVVLIGMTIAFVGATIRAAIGVGIPSTLWDARWFIIRFGITGMALVWWQLLAYGISMSIQSNSAAKRD